MQATTARSPERASSTSDVSLLEFDALLMSPPGSVEGLRAHITRLIEGIDKESTLVSVVQLLELDRRTLSAPSTTDTHGADVTVSSASSMIAKLSLNCDSRPSMNVAPPAPFASSGNRIGEDTLLEENESEMKSLEVKEVENQDQQQDLGTESAQGDGEVEQAKRDEADESPPPLMGVVVSSEGVPQMIHGRRAAVSAESLPLNVIQSYTPPVVEKTPEEERVVRAGVMACHLFSNMDSRDRAIIVRALRPETYLAGTDILKQGGASLEKLFLITQGTCEVIKNGRAVHTLHIGSTFGELEMMYHQPLCAATIRCVTNCTLYTLDQHTYHHIILAVSLHKRKKYEELLLNVGFLKTMSNYDRMLIAEALVTRMYRQGEYIIRFGEPGKWMHIIVEGEVSVVGRQQGKKREILRLKEGDVVGELEFVFNHLSVADVVASSLRVVTAQIQRKHFELIIGPIQDNLKEYVVNSGIYTHYLDEANDRIKAELSLLGKRAKRMASKEERESALLDTVDACGEIIIPAPKEKVLMMQKANVVNDNGGRGGARVGANEQGTITNTTTTTTTTTTNITQNGGCDGAVPGSKNVLFRFPLTTLHANSLAMIGLREDGSILMWNGMMVRLTGYTAQEAIGQHIYTFLLEAKDQTTIHDAICDARQYTGDVEAFFEEKGIGRGTLYTFARIDGLTKARLHLTVLPSIVSHGTDAAEIMLAVGEEQRVSPHEAFDKSQLLLDQISTVLQDGDCTYEERLHQIASVLSSFDTTCRAMMASTEDLHVVNIRQMLGQVIMDYGAQCVANDVAVCQRFEGLYTENAYLNAKSLPECLRYAMSNCTHHLDHVQVTITVSITENNGLEFLVIEFHDDGPGFPVDLLDDIQHGRASDKYPQVHRVRAAMERQGGSMTVVSVPGDTSVTFVVPFVPAREEVDNRMKRRPQCPDTSTSLSGAGSYSLRSLGTNSGGGMPSNSCHIPAAKHTFTTLVVEDTPAHRNMLCSFLWERKHAVLPAYNLDEMEQLIDVADILFIDPHQSVFQSGDSGNCGSSGTAIDPIALLREKAGRVAVVITGSEMEESSVKAYHAAGFFTLKKPCTPIEALRCIFKAEEMIAQYKVEAERIVQTRETLSKNSRGAWQRGKMLGKGSFGAVYEATEVLTGGKMAVKEMQLGKHDLQIEQFLNEISTMCKLQHPNIIHYFYCEEKTEENVIRVFMEYAAGGTLQQLLQRKGKLDFKEYQSLLRDIVEGASYIHSMHYVHGDLKTANVLLSAEGKGKIGDFGTARVVGEGELLYQMQGSLLYMSPECMAASDKDEDGLLIGYSFPSDIWSLGCIALEMATNKPPFSYMKGVKGPIGLTQYIMGLHDTPDLSPLFDGPPSIVEFVSACLNPDPSKRPTAAQLLHFSIFSEATDEGMKSALQALKRAQLLHVLSSFVAFQEPDEAERCKSLIQRRRTVRRESDFFYSSSSDDEGEVEDDNIGEGEAEVGDAHGPEAVEGVNVPDAVTPEDAFLMSTSGMEPLPKSLSHTKKRSRTRSGPRVGEEFFFASSSSSGSRMADWAKEEVEGENNVDKGIGNGDDEDDGIVHDAEAKGAQWNSMRQKKMESATSRRDDMPSPFSCLTNSFAFAARSIAFMGASMDDRNALANLDLQLQHSQQQRQQQQQQQTQQPQQSSSHEDYNTSTEPFHQTLRQSSSSKLSTQRPQLCRIKNMFSVEDLGALPRESSPDAKCPHTRSHGGLPTMLSSHHSFRQHRRFAVAPPPGSPSPSPMVMVESSGMRPSSYTSVELDPTTTSHSSTGTRKGNSSGVGELSALHHALLEVLEQARSSCRAGTVEPCRRQQPYHSHPPIIRKPVPSPASSPSYSTPADQHEEKADVNDDVIAAIGNLALCLEKRIVELKAHLPAV